MFDKCFTIANKTTTAVQKGEFYVQLLQFADRVEALAGKSSHIFDLIVAAKELAKHNQLVWEKESVDNLLKKGSLQDISNAFSIFEKYIVNKPNPEPVLEL